MKTVTATKAVLPSASLYKLGYAFIMAGLVFTTSCNKVLDQSPQNEVQDASSITNRKGGIAAMAGLYNELQNSNYYGSNFLIISDVSSNQGQSIGTWDFYREMDNYQVSLGNTENGNFYARAYRAINQANNLIAAAPGLADASDADKNKMMGQAYFVRALAYFDLTRLYGGVPGVVGALGVPITLTPSRQIDESSFPPRATLDASYKQVEDDLLQAENLLLSTADRSQASKGAARALLSRLYLYTGNFAKAAEYATLVIGEANYALNPSYTDIFLTKLSTESIFELNYNAADVSNIRNWYFPTSSGGRGDLAAHTSFYEKAKADPKDIRGTLFGFAASAGIYYPTKYNKAGNIDNIHILRIAEMYLNRAEARAKTNDLTGAIADLNVVRKRAGVDEVNPSGQAAVLAAIWNEQQLEFAFEGHSFFDYVRTGQALTQLVNVERKNGPPVSLTIPGRQVFPMPSFEVDANSNIEQNEAYQ
ncbi:RagB/SusD family nutrient uptake outer membrane protein [Foetidibacter luteolus]|uniref:RagB/SusD family nutrient uptake outer membrane protein n=1 Tax=Foetidibacter luteolus TaxID=2608880 RepID=UPI001A99EADB|nr:RagB/SusD family nutrient uptake outer membrane protein [Foetidibacter luteolus]